MKRNLLVFLMFLSATAFAQDTLTGRVTDDRNDPLPGVSLLLKGTSRGTVTDANGEFRIPDVPSDAVVQVSFIGFVTQNVDLAGRTHLDITLQPDVQSLQEVVVVGYGEQKKSVVTGAISSVKSKDLENMPVMRLEQSLQGRTSGLTITSNSGAPGAAATIRIRGTTTIGDSDPLYLVDGVPIGGGIEYLNQADIESIEVLKDAASAAIYGARAANGVIMVTTKNGRSGQMSVNYNGYAGVQQPWRKLDLLNATEYATLLNEATVAGGGSLRFADPASLGEGTNWQDEVFSNRAAIQSHDLSLAAGSEKSTYYASLGYFDQEGIVAPSNSSFNRLTLRLNSSHKITPHVMLGNNISYTRIKTKGVDPNSEWGSPLNRAINIDPITPVVVTDPTLWDASPYNIDNVVRDALGRPYGISNIVTSEILNPVAALQVAQSNNWSDKIVGNMFLEVEPVKGLKARSSLGVDLAFWGDENFSPLFYLNATNQNTLNDYSRNVNRGLFWQWENTLTYSFSIDKHNFNALAGMSAQRNYGEQQGGTLTGIPVDHLDDASLGFPVSQENQYFHGSEYQETLASMFGRINYNFDERYLLTAIVRRDGSSRFGSNYLYGVFPSVSAGWVASSEGFWPDNNAVNFLKIRGSWGVNGNNRIGDFRFVSTVGGGRNYTLGGTLVNGVSPNAISNADLRWEETTQANIGFDATVFNDFTLSFDLYSKKTTGMLLQIDVPWYVGNTGPIGNIADMDNRGYEVELGYRKNIGEVGLRFNANASHINNEVVFLGADKLFLGGQVFGPQGVQITRTEVGRNIGFFYGFKTNGIFQNEEEVAAYVNDEGEPLLPKAAPGDIRFVDYNKDGVIDNDDRTMIGNPTPDWTFGFTASATWKGFDLTLFGQGVYGNDVFQAIRRFDLPTANWTTEALGRWTGEGTSSYFPRLVLNDPNQNFSRSSDFYVKDGSYFRIKTLQIGYTLPQMVTDKVGINKVRVYVMGHNLATFTRYSGFDPEIGGGSFGVDRGIYPQARSFMAGLNIGF